MGFIRDVKPNVCTRARSVPFYEEIKNQISQRLDSIYHQVYSLIKNEMNNYDFYQTQMGKKEDKFKYDLIKSISMLDNTRKNYFNDQLTFIHHEYLHFNQVITQ
jgi:hypothetical protein